MDNDEQGFFIKATSPVQDVVSMKSCDVLPYWTKLSVDVKAS